MKRFDCTTAYGHGWMDESERGAYVRYEDAQKLVDALCVVYSIALQGAGAPMRAVESEAKEALDKCHGAKQHVQD